MWSLFEQQEEHELGQHKQDDPVDVLAVKAAKAAAGAAVAGAAVGWMWSARGNRQAKRRAAVVHSAGAIARVLRPRGRGEQIERAHAATAGGRKRSDG